MEIQFINFCNRGESITNKRFQSFYTKAVPILLKFELKNTDITNIQGRTVHLCAERQKVMFYINVRGQP